VLGVHLPAGALPSPCLRLLTLALTPPHPTSPYWPPHPPPTHPSAIDEHFPADRGVRVIAEPGRYFAETSATLFATILGQRPAPQLPRPAPAPAAAPPPTGGPETAPTTGVFGGAGCAQPERDYWLSDSTYGSFRIQVAVDGLEPTYSVLRSPLLPPPGPELAAPAACRLWGDSDVDADCVHRGARLPRLRNGDWLAFPFAGAYTICSASNFGSGRGAEPTKLFVVSDAAARDLGPYNDTALRTAAAAAAVATPAAPPPALTGAFDAAAAAAADMLRALSVGRRSCAGGEAEVESELGSAGSEVTAGPMMSSDGGAPSCGGGAARTPSRGGSAASAGDAPMGGCEEAAAPVRRQP
jgi:hypothetical protein